MKTRIALTATGVLFLLLVLSFYVSRRSTDRKPELAENRVSITGTVSNGGYYSLPDAGGLQLSGLIAMAGYDEARAAVSHVEVFREVNEDTRLVMHRNLAAVLSGEESDLYLSPQDAVCIGEIEPLTKETPRWRFNPVIELVVGDDNAGRDAFIDFDAATLVTPPDDIDVRDRSELRRWMSSSGTDALGDTASGVRGLVGFDMVASKVDNHYWNRDADAVSNCLFIKSYEFPVLLTGADKVPATYLFKTREHGMGVLQIVGFIDNPEGVKIRYKSMAKASSWQASPCRTKIESCEPLHSP